MQLRAMILAAGVGLGLALKWLIPGYAGLSQNFPPARPYVAPEVTPNTTPGKSPKKAIDTKAEVAK